MEKLGMGKSVEEIARQIREFHREHGAVRTEDAPAVLDHLVTGIINRPASPLKDRKK